MNTNNMAEKSFSTDADQLAHLGHAESFERRFSKWTMLGLAFTLLNTWSAMGASLSLALPSGGPVVVVWGLVVAGVFNLSLAASLAEFLSAFPTAAGLFKNESIVRRHANTGGIGQYYWVAVCSPPSLRAGLSWITGWITLSGWASPRFS